MVADAADSWLFKYCTAVLLKVLSGNAFSSDKFHQQRAETHGKASDDCFLKLAMERIFVGTSVMS